MIHHAVLGSLGRFIAILLEQHAGALPFWLAPEQVAVAPIAAEQQAYAGELLSALREAGVRGALYEAGDTLSRRIVAARHAGIPVMAIVGAREAADRLVALRERDGNQATLPFADGVAALAARRSSPAGSSPAGNSPAAACRAIDWRKDPPAKDYP